MVGSADRVTGIQMNIKVLSHLNLTAHPAPDRAAAFGGLQLHIAKAISRCCAQVEGITLEIMPTSSGLVSISWLVSNITHHHPQVEGITLEIMQQALGQAREGRRTILAAMQGCAPAPRRQLSDHAPRIGRMQVRGRPLSACTLCAEPSDRRKCQMQRAVRAIFCNLPVGALCLLVVPLSRSCGIVSLGLPEL